MVSFIVSHHNRAMQLIGALSSLFMQGCDKEIIITDNSTDLGNIALVESFCALCPEVFKRIDTSAECNPTAVEIAPNMKSANIGAKAAKGDWLCFPTDDSYYVPGFAAAMLGYAKEFDLELVYCNFVMDQRWNGMTYQVVEASPIQKLFDRGCFMVKREVFEAYGGFALTDRMYDDINFCRTLVFGGVRHGHCPGVMVVHN